LDVALREESCTHHDTRNSAVIAQMLLLHYYVSDLEFSVFNFALLLLLIDSTDLLLLSLLAYTAWNLN
jgi:hypothetical protein